MNKELQRLNEQLNARLDAIEQFAKLGAKSVLSIEEAALFTGYSTGWLYVLTHRRDIPHYKKGGKLYFKKEELERWMTERPVKTKQAIDSEAETYTVLHSKTQPKRKTRSRNTTITNQ
jgi:excisionase family DNA binding protein